MLRDLDKRVPGAPNFRYREFVKSDVALRYDIKNEPDENQWRCIEKIAVNILQPVRRKFGRIRITSGFRSVELCLKIGSTSSSNHARGQAVDFEPLKFGITLCEVIEWINDNLEFRWLIAEYFPRGWIHASWRENQNIKKLKLKDKDHNYEIVTIDKIKMLYKKD